MDALRDRATFVKESLHKSQTITDSMVSILGSFDHRLSALETAMRPTQVRSYVSLLMAEGMNHVNHTLPIIAIQCVYVTSFVT